MGAGGLRGRSACGPGPEVVGEPFLVGTRTERAQRLLARGSHNRTESLETRSGEAPTRRMFKERPHACLPSEIRSRSHVRPREFGDAVSVWSPPLWASPAPGRRHSEPRFWGPRQGAARPTSRPWVQCCLQQLRRREGGESCLAVWGVGPTSS